VSGGETHRIAGTTHEVRGWLGGLAMRDPRLRDITLLWDEVTDADRYPFSVPVIRSLERLELTSRVEFFVGENGSGKSTLLEAIALAAGFGAEGGSQNFTARTTDDAAAAQPLADALRLSWTKKLRRGFFLRAESFFNVATAVDDYGAGDSYGGRSLHAQSHGESFLSLVQNRFEPGGLYLLDEPEAAVSPQRQLSLLVLLHELVQASPDTQLIVATHAPILLALPGARILSFDGDAIEPISWEQAPSVDLMRSFLERPAWWLDRLLGEP